MYKTDSDSTYKRLVFYIQAYLKNRESNRTPMINIKRILSDDYHYSKDSIDRFMTFISLQDNDLNEEDIERNLRMLEEYVQGKGNDR